MSTSRMPVPYEQTPEYRRHMQETKEFGQMAKGRVRLWNEERGYGFITPEDGGQDVLVNRAALGSGLTSLRVGDIVVYDRPEPHPYDPSCGMRTYSVIVDTPSEGCGGKVPSTTKDALRTPAMVVPALRSAEALGTELTSLQLGTALLALHRLRTAAAEGRYRWSEECTDAVRYALSQLAALCRDEERAARTPLADLRRAVPATMRLLPEMQDETERTELLHLIIRQLTDRLQEVTSTDAESPDKLPGRHACELALLVASHPRARGAAAVPLVEAMHDALAGPRGEELLQQLPTWAVARTVSVLGVAVAGSIAPPDRAAPDAAHTGEWAKGSPRLPRLRAVMLRCAARILQPGGVRSLLPTAMLNMLRGFRDARAVHPVVCREVLMCATDERILPLLAPPQISDLLLSIAYSGVLPKATLRETFGKVARRAEATVAAFGALEASSAVAAFAIARVYDPPLFTAMARRAAEAGASPEDAARLSHAFVLTGFRDPEAVKHVCSLVGSERLVAELRREPASPSLLWLVVNLSKVCCSQWDGRYSIGLPLQKPAAEALTALRRVFEVVSEAPPADLRKLRPSVLLAYLAAAARASPHLRGDARMQRAFSRVLDVALPPGGEGEGILSSFDAEGVALLAWSVSKMEGGARTAAAFAACAAHFAARKDLIRALHPLHLGWLFQCFAHWHSERRAALVSPGAAGTVQALLPLLCAQCVRPDVLPLYYVSQASQILSSLDKMGESGSVGDQAARAITERIATDEALLEHTPPSHALLACYALTHIAVRANDIQWYQVHWRKIWQKSVIPKASVLSANEVTSAVFCFSKVQERSPALVASIMQLASAKLPPSGMKADAAAATALGLARLSAGRPPLLCALAEQAMHEALTPQHVYQLLWSFAASGVDDAALVDRIGAAAAQWPADREWAGWNARVASWTLWSLAKLKRHPPELVRFACAAVMAEAAGGAVEQFNARTAEQVMLGLCLGEVRGSAVDALLLRLCDHAERSDHLQQWRDATAGTVIRVLSSRELRHPRFVARARREAARRAGDGPLAA